MEKLKENEVRLRRRMSVAEIINEVVSLMGKRQIPVRFIPYRGG
jgi:hypothetical protein